EHQAQEEELLERVRQGQTVAHVESERIDRRGVVIPIALSLSPMRNESGAVVGSAMIVRDISAYRDAERALRERVRQLDVLSEAGQALIMGSNDSAQIRR